MEILISGRAPKPKRKSSVDHETGLLHLPGKEPLPLIGPTSGRAYEKLKQDEKNAVQQKLDWERILRSTYQCLQCRRKFNALASKLGHSEPLSVRPEWRDLGRAVPDSFNLADMYAPTPPMMRQIIGFRCANLKCNGPVVLVEDALDLREAPGGRV